MTAGSDNALRKLAKTGNNDAVAELVSRRIADGGTIWREPPLVRLRIADTFVGRVVDVDDDMHRNGTAIFTITGRLVSAAYGGNSSGAIILRFPNRRDALVELARVAAIRPAPISPVLAATYPR